MEALLNWEHLEQIKNHLQTELLKRGFNAKIDRINEKVARNGIEHNYVEFETEPFQTIPIIFKKVWITNFSSWIRDHKTNKNYWVITIQVHIRYEHFTGGHNGTNLFTFKCMASKDEDYVYINQ